MISCKSFLIFECTGIINHIYLPMKRRNLIKGLATAIPAWWLSKSSAAAILNSTKLNGEQIADVRLNQHGIR
jgi:hypothetical protein